jgi:hypothetical protein
MLNFVLNDDTDTQKMGFFTNPPAGKIRIKLEKSG